MMPIPTDLPDEDEWRYSALVRWALMWKSGQFVLESWVDELIERAERCPDFIRWVEEVEDYPSEQLIESLRSECASVDVVDMAGLHTIGFDLVNLYAADCVKPDGEM